MAEQTKEIRLATNLSGETVQLTKSGKKELEEKLKVLIEVERPQVAEELKEARAQGDLSENADYDAAKNKQGELEAEISRIQDILSRVEIISERAVKKVRTGSTVTFKMKGKKRKVQIVGPVEVDPNAEIPKIGANSPFAEAVMGLEEGDSARVHAVKPYNVEITKIA